MKVIGQYTSGEAGPLLVLMACIHGNETHGLFAAKQLLSFLYQTKPKIKGTFLAILANEDAVKAKKRFIDLDMNRIWTSGYLENPLFESYPEVISAKQIIAILEEVMATELHDKLIIVDIHSTSAIGSPFIVPGYRAPSMQVLRKSGFPIVDGLLACIKGSLLHYFDKQFCKKPCITVVIEAGNHTDPFGVEAAKQFTMIQMMNYLALDWIVEDATALSLWYELYSIHHINDGVAFEMRPGYQNFQSIKKGEWLATEDGTPIVSPINGKILMPLYQKKGSEGFFLLSQKPFEEHKQADAPEQELRAY